MSSLLPGLSSKIYPTSRLQTHVLAHDRSGIPVVFIHGNVSSGQFFEKTLTALRTKFRGLAPDPFMKPVIAFLEQPR